MMVRVTSVVRIVARALLQAAPRDPRAACVFGGGEEAGMRRVQEYLWEKDLLRKYARPQPPSDPRPPREQHFLVPGNPRFGGSWDFAT